MSNKSPQKNSAKKPSRSVKEKRAAKKAKHTPKASVIPPTGH